MNTPKIFRHFVAIVPALVLLVALVSILPNAFAHHGWSEYEQTKLVKLSGKVTQNGHEHPHGFIKFDADGKEWIVILAPPFRMENRGLSKSDITAGSQVSVEGYINRTKLNEMRAERIMVNNKTIELR